MRWTKDDSMPSMSGLWQFTAPWQSRRLLICTIFCTKNFPNWALSIVGGRQSADPLFSKRLLAANSFFWSSPLSSMKLVQNSLRALFIRAVAAFLFIFKAARSESNLVLLHLFSAFVLSRLAILISSLNKGTPGLSSIDLVIKEACLSKRTYACMMYQFATAHKTVFPAPTSIGLHRLRNTWSHPWEVICHKKVQQSFLNQSLDPTNQKFLDPPLVTRHICIHVDVIPSEGKKKKADETAFFFF